MTKLQYIKHLIKNSDGGLVAQLLNVPPQGKPVTITVQGQKFTLWATAGPKAYVP